MNSDIDICNLALMRLGTRSTIAALSEGSAEANVCALVYPVVREALLARHPWNFARRRVLLADLGHPPFGWRYRYATPSDCLRVWEVDGPTTPFEISGDLDTQGNPIQVILTDRPRAWLTYTARVTDPALFNVRFVEALSWMLAAEMAIALTGDTALAQGCLQAAGNAITAAEADDANQRFEHHDRIPEALAVRGFLGKDPTPWH